ncbi:ANKHD1 [Symbiodinium pilosum]|uniref:ANKHD1 protein n=1 Tax=Symbiodinium pilosum TaxID=2952 RepID=A0A812ML50_SYMPI|nr:ANKHD1 [Symbiodinium pilosum]
MHQNGIDSITQRDEAGWSLLCYAAVNGTPSLVSTILKRRGDPNDSIRKPKPEAKHMSLRACGRVLGI